MGASRTNINRKPLDFSNYRVNKSFAVDPNKPKKPVKLPQGTLPMATKFKKIENPYKARMAENEKKIADMLSRMNSMSNRPVVSRSVSPKAVEPDYLSMDNINFDKISDLLGKVDAGQGYVYRDGKWNRINLNSITDPDFTVGYSYKGNDLLKGRDKLDKEYVKYLDAVDSAKESAKEILNKEKANALTRGVKYSYTEDDMKKLINDEFSKIWSPEKQDRINGMVLEFGNPSNFKGFSLKPNKVEVRESVTNVPNAESRLNIVGGSSGGMSSNDTLIQPTGRLRQFLGGRKSLLGD
jgi:hypothetical protein